MTTKKRVHSDANLLDAALRVVDLSGWKRFTFSAVAQEADVPMAEVLKTFPTRAHLIMAWGETIDNEVLNNDLRLDPRDSIRDRLFDLMMRRFDAMAPHREAVRALLPGFGCDLMMATAAACSLSRSMTVTLEAAGVDVRGLGGAIKVKGLKGVYLYTLKAWLKDSSPDSASTMAALDKSLGRVDSLASTLFNRGSSKGYEETVYSSSDSAI